MSTSTLLVLIHGGALSHRFYRNVTPIFENRGYKVLAPDLPGHGSSTKLGPFTFEKARQYILDLVSAQASDGKPDIVLVGVSLGGQVVLDILQHSPGIAGTAIVSGAPIHPPDDKAAWEMPKIPTEQEWIDIMAEDINTMGMANASGIQQASFDFHFNPGSALPPVLVMVGENDVAMAKRDFEKLAELVKSRNKQSESMVLPDSWHNHPIDIPERFAEAVDAWVRKVKIDAS